jgi:hypothetical protein
MRIYRLTCLKESAIRHGGSLTLGAQPACAVRAYEIVVDHRSDLFV